MKLFCLLARWHGALALVLVALILPLTGVEGHDANVEYSLREPQPVDRHPESNERIEFKPKQVRDLERTVSLLVLEREGLKMTKKSRV